MRSAAFQAIVVAAASAFMTAGVCLGQNLAVPIPRHRGRADARAHDSAGATSSAKLKRLYEEHQWQAIVRLTASPTERSADADYYRGLALAKLKRFTEAKQAFERGRKNAPADKRFPTELAGIAFLEKNYGAARRDLKAVLRIDPKDVYATNFLATVYELEGNLTAALKYWNRLGKPLIHAIGLRPQLRIDPVLLNRAFAFSPGTVLESAALRTTQARVHALGIFSQPDIRLEPLASGQFDADFTAAEQNGWGDSKLNSFLSLLRGVPYETIYPHFFNIRGAATNFQSLLRWDPQKERAFASLSGPLGETASRRYRLYIDGRRENWNIAHTFFGSTAPVTGMQLEKIEAGADFISVVNGRLTWTTGIDLSGRTFRDLTSQPSAAAFFRNGFALEDHFSLDALLADFPENRQTLTADASTQFGKMFARPANDFLQAEAGLLSRWYPRQQGDDFEMTAQLREGRTWGVVPFDDLFILGLERDNDLWLRAHIGTEDGRKGSAPLGRNYTLFNWDDFKKMYGNGFFNVRLGPFFDSGKISDPTGDFGSMQWLFDTGLELKVGLLGSATLELFFGKDLRTGANAFYGMTARATQSAGSSKH